MNNIPINIQQLVTQAKELLKSIPKKSDQKIKEREIRQQYKLNEPIASIGREYLGNIAGDLGKDIFGAKKKTGRTVAKAYLKQQSVIQINNEIKELERQFDYQCKNIERRYNDWFAEAEQLIKSINCQKCLKKLKDSKQKVKIETKINWGINALNYAVDYLHTPQKQKHETSLVKTGEPLKGRNILKNFVKNAKEYIKIQEPYPTPEILELIEETHPDIKCILLLGPIKKSKDKEKFENDLSLLRRAGRNIEVLLIKCNETAPFHDRFFISEKKGLSIGTSVSGLGLRDSTVNELNDYKEIEKRFDEYIIGPKTRHRGSECKRGRM